MQSFIIIKGQPKGLWIERFQMRANGMYEVKFKNSPITYRYRNSDVTVLKDALWHDSRHCKVYISGCEQRNIAEVCSFRQGSQTHWRITLNTGDVRDYLHGSIQVVESCLADNIAKNTFEYLKRVAQVNELGKDEEHGGILPALYEKIDFIDKELVATPYLHPEKNKPRRYSAPDLVFPFGCNSSQEKAVSAAFESQISVIQDPPGTGKTQTILNIIANILVQGKTVMVVSNNNSATINVLEKLQKYGLHFIVAPLGSRENKEKFIKNQPAIPEELQTWKLSLAESLQERRGAAERLKQMQQVFSLQETLASARQELKDIEQEWEHFKRDNQVQDDTYRAKSGINARHFLNLWLRFQLYAEGGVVASTGVFGRLVERLRWTWMNFMGKHLLGVKSTFDKGNILPVILELQALYYLGRIGELSRLIEDTTGQLASIDAKALNEELSAHSMNVLKGLLYEKYHKDPRRFFPDAGALRSRAGELLQQYPVVLSTTFSARTSVPGMIYDYLIMDEASQVSIDTGALALTCARNAVIVGDTLQLPNVVTADDKMKLNVIFDEYKVSQGYDSANYSFLQSVCSVLPHVPQTLLREHYRCHPKIINFCNQRFYGGNLLIMTEDHDEENVMMAIKTTPGHHTRGHYNQREIDVVRQEVMPSLHDVEDIGIITPYNHQVNQFNRQMPSVEAATVHKYQGREKDTIIMSVVDDQITEFSDDPNLLNVAISRAQKRFCLVVSGNEQERKGNIADLLDYIAYNNFSVTESKVNSIFDYLYSHYTAERMAFLAEHRSVSEYDSENLTYSLIENILKKYPEYAHLDVFCHIPLRTMIKDWTLLSEDERKYISHYSTHLDFLIINHVTKKPVLAIETDGYNYHREGTDQHVRDVMKNHILELYALPLLRLSTTGSGEEARIVGTLSSLV